MTQWLNMLAEMIRHNLWIAPVLCVAAGVITSFTPCSLSSIPMIIAYIGGSAKQDTKKAFRLSLTMAAGLSVTFIVFGSLASVIGHFMHEIGKWWYVFLGVVMVLMALPGKDNNVPTKGQNDPLTLEQLREMDGEPVYVASAIGEHSAWYIVDLEENELKNPWDRISLENWDEGYPYTAYLRLLEEEKL